MTDRLYRIDAAVLDALSAQARTAPRLRKNLNLHALETDACNRLLNALEPGTYVQPHRHLDPLKDETMLMVRGRLGVIAFHDDGRVAEAVIIEAGGPRPGVNIPHGLYHATVCRETGAVFFEAKAGPYRPLAPEERAPWAPPEGSPEVAAYLEALVSQVPGL